jgi:hypothetical protein
VQCLSEHFLGLTPDPGPDATVCVHDIYGTDDNRLQTEAEGLARRALLLGIANIHIAPETLPDIFSRLLGCNQSVRSPREGRPRDTRQSLDIQTGARIGRRDVATRMSHSLRDIPPRGHVTRPLVITAISGRKYPCPASSIQP